MARAFFDFGLAGSHLTRMLSTFALDALHLACALFNFCSSIVCFWLGGLTCGQRLVYLGLGCLHVAWNVLILARVFFICDADGVHFAGWFCNGGLVALHLYCF